MNPEMSFREVRIQSGNAESIPECNLSVEKASQSCDSSIHKIKRARQKVKTEFGFGGNCLSRGLGLFSITLSHIQIFNRSCHIIESKAAVIHSKRWIETQ